MKKRNFAVMGLGWQELVIVLVIIMIIFGAGKLPDVARSLGMGVKEFKQEATAPVVPAETSTTSTETLGSEPQVDGAAAERVRADANQADTVSRNSI
jgi:sec-independent protein translocase protein TatA